MIYYQGGWQYTFHRVFRISGSLAPKTFSIAIPVALFAGVLTHVFPKGSSSFLWEEEGILLETQAWGGFSFLVGFLIVFRTQQAYGRFWEGCTASHQMRAEWFDACSSVMSFTKHSRAPPESTRRFKELIIRLTSMLHAAALSQLEMGARRSDAWTDTYELIDPESIDAESLEAVTASDERVELLYEWISQLIVESIPSGVLSIPPPLLSRTFQEFANGMVQFHNAMKIAYIPIPFPYVQTCDSLLLVHTLIVPVVTSQWVTNSVWAFVFTIIQVLVLWSLNLVALEIENPFGRDSNDMDGQRMQTEMNQVLLLLIRPSTERTPRLSLLFDQKTDEEKIQTRSLGSVLNRANRLASRTRSHGVMTGEEDASAAARPTTVGDTRCDELFEWESSSDDVAQPQSTSAKKKKNGGRHHRHKKFVQPSNVKCVQCRGPLTKVEEADAAMACGECAGGAAGHGGGRVSGNGSGGGATGQHDHERWLCRQCSRYLCGGCVRALVGPLATDDVVSGDRRPFGDDVGFYI